MKNTLTRAMMCFAATVFVVAGVMVAASAARAQSGRVCVYANDNVDSFDGPNTVDGYLVTADSQTYLTPIETGGEGTGYSSGRDIVVNPTKSIVYASDAHTGDVAAMRIDPATCNLTLLGDYHVDRSNAFGMGLAINPDGKWLYVTGISAKTINLLAILPDGSLSHVHQTLALPAEPSSMAVTPDGATLVLGSPSGVSGVNQALSYSIDPSTGMLTQVSAIPTQDGLSGLAIDSGSKFVYGSEPSDNLMVAVLEIGPGSTLTRKHIYDFTEVSYSGAEVLLSVDGKYLYIPGAGLIASCAVGRSSGNVMYAGQTSYSDGAVGLATSKNGAFLFSGSGFVSGNFGIFSVAQDSSLTSLGTFPTASLGVPEWIAAKTF